MVSHARLVLACLPLLALAAAPAPAPAAYPGTNGAVAYVGKVDGVTNLLAREGATVRGVLKGNTISSPAWSPQGQRLAAVRTGPDGKDIWIVGADGQGARQLTASGGDAADPTWAPGGDEVAYTDGAAGHRHIYATTADGATQRQITFGAADERDPAWSSRDRIAYVVRTANGDDLYAVPGHGGKPRRLTHLPGNEFAPAWSPDGRHLVFVHAGQIWTAGANGRGARRVGRLTGSTPAWSPDGRRLALATGPAGRRRIEAVDLQGRLVQVLSSRRTDGRSPDWQPAGFDPVIAAGGDVACDPSSPYFNGGIGVPRHCGQLRTGNLLLDRDLWGVLVLGDTQYQDGSYEKFLQSYDPTWGRAKYLEHPVIGNHEYQTAGDGYWDYFNGQGAANGPAGPRGEGWYSFDIGTWHVVALNSNCHKVGCGAGSPQERWLAADLAAHPAKCTLAMWHSPLFSSYRGGDVATTALWQTLYAANADVVLVGHHHFYERMAPQTAGGDLDPIHGIRQFTVGTGGMSIDDAEGRDPNSEAVIETTFGVLRLTLHADSYDWAFESASSDPATDTGSYPCH